MIIQLNFFGALQEYVGESELKMDVEKCNFKELKQLLILKHPNLNQKTFVFAQNNEIKSESDEIVEAIIDVFPPFSGG